MPALQISRRTALTAMLAGLHAAGTGTWGEEALPSFCTRGVVLYPWDLSLEDWPERAAQAGITTMGLHAGRSLSVLQDFVHSKRGGLFLEKCREPDFHVADSFGHAVLIKSKPCFFFADYKTECL